MPVSTVSNGNGREWCKPRGKRDVLSWMFFHPMKPGPSGARAGQSRGDGARTVSASAPHTHSLFLQCASLHIGAGTKEAGWCQETSLVQIISQLEQRGSHRDSGSCNTAAHPTLTAPQEHWCSPSASLLRLQPCSEDGTRIWTNCASSRCQLGDI